jgi:hypothetical protein
MPEPGIGRGSVRAMRRHLWLVAARSAFLAVAAALLLAGPGCEDNDSLMDHVPPDGQGSMIFDNQSPDRIRVYLDGRYAGEVKDWDDLTLDLDPGVYRVFLDGKDSERTYQKDADVLDGRLTVLHISPSSSSAFSYNVWTEYDE